MSKKTDSETTETPKPEKQKASVEPNAARELAIRENITIAEAYSRLSGADEE